jgi:putative inorganic carbon (HCO3(-)) transporter
MRDLIIFLIVVGSVPMILRQAWIGIIMWSWLGYMNPHRLTWGFAYSFPFAQLVAAVTLLAFLFDKTPKRLPNTFLTWIWLALIFWFNVTTLTAIYPEYAQWEWDRTMKIQLFAVLTVILINTPAKVMTLVWTIVLSLGFFGVKGGIFSLLTGGEYLVFGPADSFFADNNALALVLIMTFPLMFYLQTQVNGRLAKLAFFGAMALTALSILGSHSRGALLAGMAMAGTLWLKGPYKVRTGIALLLAIPPLLMFMPDAWWERMQTIREFQSDGSAMGRINAWWFALNLALDRPLVGGGFQVFSRELFLTYAPNPTDFHDAHSIYFEILAEQGFVGLGLFLLLGLVVIRTAGRIERQARALDSLRWASGLASMLQVSIVGYAVGGAFLGLAYFDLYYNLIALVLVLDTLVRSELREGHMAVPAAGARAQRVPRPAAAPTGGRTPLPEPATRLGAGGRNGRPASPDARSKSPASTPAPRPASGALDVHQTGLST